MNYIFYYYTVMQVLYFFLLQYYSVIIIIINNITNRITINNKYNNINKLLIMVPNCVSNKARSVINNGSYCAHDCDAGKLDVAIETNEEGSIRDLHKGSGKSVIK